MSTDQNNLLHVPIEQLELSNELKTLTETLGFHTLNDLLGHHTRELMILPGFKVGLLHEYVTYLEEKGLGHLVDQFKKKQ